MKLNNDVPTEAIVKQLIKENTKLHHEISVLKMENSNKENAIRAFKKWQATVAERKWQYWLNEGLELATTKPDMALLRNLRGTLGHNESYRKWLDKCENMAAHFEAYADRLLKSTGQEE